MRKVASIKSWVEGFNEVKKAVDEVELMPEFIIEGLATEEDAESAYAKASELVEKLELRNMLSGEEDLPASVRCMVEDCGYTWTGRYPWDWHCHCGFPIGYDIPQREGK